MTVNLSEVDLSKLSPSSKHLVRFGLQLGWVARNTRMLGVTLQSPVDHGQTISLPATTNINQNRQKSWAKKLVRYGDPLKVAVFMNTMDNAERKARKEGVGEEEDAGIIIDQFPEGSPIMGEDDKVPSEYHAPSDPEPAAVPEPTIVTQRPWLANQTTTEKNATVYASETTVERKWSDGAVDYQCTKCEFTDPNPRRVSRHYARSSKDTHPSVGRPTETMRAEPYVPATGSRESRVARLAREITEAWDAVGEGPTARALAEKMIEARDARHEREDREAVPLTAEETLERVRRLVDDGSYLRRMEESRELEDRVSALNQQLSENMELMREASTTIASQAERLEQFETWASLLPGVPDGPR